MEQCKKTGGALRRLTLAVLWRRRGASLLLIAVAALGVFASTALHSLSARQEAAMAELERNARIQCVVTTAQGKNSNNLKMISVLVDMLLGARHERGCYLDEYVRDVRALASAPLDIPAETELRRILSFDSDASLSAVEGASIRLAEGWEESAFRTDQRVCLIPEGMEAQPGPDGALYVSTREKMTGVSVDLQVIGTVSGGPGNVIWCPFRVQRQEGVSEAFQVDSCSFDIGDNTRLEECRAAIYETFVEPKLSNVGDFMTYGVLVQDETYLATMEEFRSNLSLLRVLLPVLMALCGGISFFAAYLTTRGRVREFAVMRSLGLKRGRMFLLVFEEYALLTAAGAVLGGLAGVLLEGGLSGSALIRAGAGLAVFWAGAAAAVGSMTRVNVMKLMRTEE